MDSATSTLWTGPFSIEWKYGWISLLPCFIEFPFFNANSVDPDQTPHSVAFELGLHCLLMFLLWDARHKLAKCMDFFLHCNISAR